jgi:hypothetical protein
MCTSRRLFWQTGLQKMREPCSFCSEYGLRFPNTVDSENPWAALWRFLNQIQVRSRIGRKVSLQAVFQRIGGLEWFCIKQHKNFELQVHNLKN